MEAKQKFETIVQEIENLIREEKYIQDKEISKMAFELVNEVLDERSRNNIFKFLMDKTVIQYISERRMMISYKKLLSNGDIHKTYQEAIDISGTGTAQAFSTKFKKIFGVSPKEAFEINDGFKYKARPSWDSLDENGVEMKMENREIIVTAIDDSKDIQNYVRDLKEFYSFNDEEAHLASNLWIDGKSSLKECFQFVADYVYGKTDLERDYRLKTDLENNIVQYLYFERNLNFDQIFRILLMIYLKIINQPLNEYSDEYLQFCGEYDYDEDDKETIKEKYDYYIKMYNESYTKYDMRLYGFYMSYISKEEAFNRLKPGITSEIELEKCKENFWEDLTLKNDAKNLDVVDSAYMNDMYEPEAWDENAIRDHKDNDYEEDEWFADEFERDVIDDNEIYAYDEAYDDLQYREFERVCDEIACLNQEEIDKLKTVRRPFKEFLDLDIESYWNSKKILQNDDFDEDIINTMDVSGLLPVT